MDGEVFFPDDGHNYLGFIYNYTTNDTRSDYGNIYIKGNGNYLRVNPWRDGNVSRLLYEEYRTPLEGKAAVTIGQWQRFRAEVIGNTCHFYVGEATVIPQLTFGVLELDEGLIGFEPRVVGAPVWIDNLTVTSIEDFSYDGSPIPARAGASDSGPKHDRCWRLQRAVCQWRLLRQTGTLIVSGFPRPDANSAHCQHAVKPKAIGPIAPLSKLILIAGLAADIRCEIESRLRVTDRP